VKIVIKISGHVFDNEDLVYRYVKTLNFVIKALPNLSIVAVCGGGSIARRYVNIVRRCTGNESKCDLVGISVSRLNALTMALSVLDSCPTIPRNIDELLELSSRYRVVFCGGFQPGQSTATVTMIIAESLGVRDVILFSNIDAVYDKDPRKYPDAKKLERVTLEELKSILSRDVEASAGTYPLLDVWAIEIAKRARLNIYLVDCKQPEKLIDILTRKSGYGTLIVPE